MGERFFVFVRSVVIERSRLVLLLGENIYGGLWVVLGMYDCKFLKMFFAVIRLM
jgi:hypothetical protein